MLNVLPPEEIVKGVAEVLRQRILPVVEGADARRQCRAAVQLLNLLAGASNQLDEVRRAELRDFGALVGASKDRPLDELRSEVADRLATGDDSIVQLQLLVRRSLDRWGELTPAGPLGEFEALDQGPCHAPDVIG